LAKTLIPMMNLPEASNTGALMAALPLLPPFSIVETPFERIDAVNFSRSAML